MGFAREHGSTFSATRWLLVVPRSVGAEAIPATPGDLSGPTFRHIAMAGENVPAGRYGQAALEASGVWAEVVDRVVRGANVRGALEWVALGEADAGVVYRTDAAAEERVRVAFTFPAETHPPIIYPAGFWPGPHFRVRPPAFLEFCQSEAAQGVFRRAGFRVLRSSNRESLRR